MRLILVFLILSPGTVFPKYTKKTRFDRSVHDDSGTLVMDNYLPMKRWTFTDYDMNFKAFRDKEENVCYLEKLNDRTALEDLSEYGTQEQITRVLYASTEALTKLEAWRIAGGRIIEFCQGRKLILLQNAVPVIEQIADPFFNMIPQDENDIVTRRVADVVLTPLISRAKRQIMFEEREKLNGNVKRVRSRRQIQQSRGRFRGQTQSQYLNMATDEQSEGKAEAEATQQSSHAVVSGSHGMGQAQSMSFGGSGCEDCLKYTTEGAPDRYVHLPNAGIIPGTRTDTTFTHGGVYPGSTSNAADRDGGTYPVGIVDIRPERINYITRIPGTATGGGGAVYPGGVSNTKTRQDGATYPSGIPGTTGGAVIQPGGVPSHTTTQGGTTYPSGIPSTTGGGVVQPGGVPSHTTTQGGTPYPSGVPGTTGGGVTYSGGVPLHTTTQSGTTYPSGIPGTTTGGAVIQAGGVPGGVITQGVEMYPGGIPITTTTGGSVVYPSTIPGTTTPGGGIVYPGGVSGTITTQGGIRFSGGIPSTKTTQGGTVYPGGVPGTSRTGGGVLYPSGIPGTTTSGGGVLYPSGIPGTTTSGGGGPYPSGIPGSTTSGGGILYPSGIPGTTTGGGVVYSNGVPGTKLTQSDVTYPSSVPSTTTTGGGVLYPGGIPGTTTTGGAVIYPSGVSNTPITQGGSPGIITTGDGILYPSGIPGTATTGGSVPYPSGIPGTTTRGGITYPTNIYPGQGSTVLQPSGDVPLANQLRKTVHYPEGVIPSGMTPTRVSTYPENTLTETPGSLTQQLSYPGGIEPGNTGIIKTGPDFSTVTTYPQSSQFKPGEGVYQPGIQVGPDGKVISYPGISGTIPFQYPIQQAQYPSSITWPNKPGEYLNQGQNIGQQYATGTGPTNTGEVSQYYQQAGNIPSIKDDNSNSQASSSVKQTESGTQASASSQGTYGQGTAQSQVTGTYSGSGSFSAQAGSSDVNKGAQSEISGSKEGAMSNAQGTGGYGKSQAQVQLNSESGATATDAQSSGWNHGTNSQVQASSRGGMADAQANGEGSTSSQAQIGFQPYLKTDEKLEKHVRPFHGGGTASAQSSMHRGQSQSQLQGSFQYGITYSGAAQAGSGSGAAASRKPFKFNFTDTELFKPIKPYNTPQITKNNESSVTNTSLDIDYVYNQNKAQGLQPSSSSRKTVIATATREISQNGTNKQNQSGEKSQVDDTMYDYDDKYDAEDYDDDNYDTSQIQSATNAKYSKNYITEQNNSDYQSQMIQVTTGNQYDVHVHQDSTMAQPGDMLQPGQSLSGYTIPPRFRGRVKSVAGEKTVAQGDGKSQSQTVSVTPIETGIAHENKSPISETRSLKTNHERLAEDHALSKAKHQKYNSFQFQTQRPSADDSKPVNVPIKPSYYTITNSFAGKMDSSKNAPKKYEHRYYTKSSTCGYFTFSCNIVYGSDGRTKICKPKIPTHPDGTPVKC
nr:mucin-5AC-like isoform X2 [Nomia melanderi]